jgi:plasmid stabilization system protein ParE
LARVVFAESARADLDDIFTWIADHAGRKVALAYTARIERFCHKMIPFPQRGTARDDLRPGLRTVGFERRATIAFTVKGEDVVILRVLYAGRSLDLAFDESF